MDWTDQENEVEPPSVTPPVVAHHARLSFINALAASALVLGVGGFGFILGHDVVKPTTTPSASRRLASPYFPSGNSSGFGGFGGSFPAISVPAQGQSSAAHDAAAAKIASKVDPGLVDIDTNLGYQDGAAAGTGMILTKNGYVLTNNHVIDGATSITARDVETGKTYSATVVGYDVTQDVALLKLSDAKGLTTITTGNSSDVTKAETVVGIGNAGGVGGTPSYAAGKILALGQSITASDKENPAGAERLVGMIEVSAAIEPGDSGGPLVNSKGNVIGMDTAGSSTTGGFGFEETGAASTQAYAIPINTALTIVKSIKNGEGSSTIHIGTTAFLGVEVRDATAASSGTSGGSSTATSGVTVAEVIPSTPAASTALVAGDVITSVNGEDVSTTTGLAAILQTLHSGESVQIGYFDQSGAASTLSVTLGSGPAQ
jgi:S1-C subfamily serine protease